MDSRENTKSFGPFYVGYVRSGSSGWKSFIPVQPAWTNEEEPPWRHGFGVLVRITKTLSFVVGIWWRTRPETPGYRRVEYEASLVDVEDDDGTLLGRCRPMPVTVEMMEHWKGERSSDHVLVPVDSGDPH